VAFLRGASARSNFSTLAPKDCTSTLISMRWDVILASIWLYVSANLPTARLT
jgi:hypothetical protein